jgi:hypothetical protein
VEQIACPHPRRIDVTTLGTSYRETMCARCGQRWAHPWNKLHVYTEAAGWVVLCPCCNRFCTFLGFGDALAFVQAHLHVRHPS